MVDLYVELIIKGRKTIEDVPSNLREAVEEELKRRGYDIDGDNLVTE